MTRYFLPLVLAAFGAAAQPALAEGPVVVELFTSQGCSSCPPADQLFGEITKRDDVVALAFHVDYWDYIGWKDEFADPDHTERQRAYARAAGNPSIYTPQMIVGGKDHIAGAKPMKLAALLEAHKAAPNPVAVALERSDGRVTIVASAAGRIRPAVVQIATFTPEAAVSIRSGENAGRELVYHNIVRDLVEVDRWDGRSIFRATVRVPGEMPVAVLVQEREAGRMLGAAMLR